MQYSYLSLVLSVDFRIISLWFLRSPIFTLPFRNSCIRGTPARWWRRCGSTGGNVRVHLLWERLDRWHCGLTQRDSGPRRKSGGRKTRQHTKQQQRAGEWPCSWQHRDVFRDRGKVWAGLLLKQRDMMAGKHLGRSGGGPKSSFILSLLFICLPHTCVHANIRTLSHSSASFSLHQSYLPTMLLPTSLHFWILSIFPSRSLSSPALSRPPLWAVSQSRSAAQRHGRGSVQPPTDR